MASPDLQARAQALNSKMEGAAKLAIDEIEKTLIRPLAKLSYKCVVECYEKAGSTQPSEQLDHCAKQCQAPYQLSHNIIQQEVNSFQDRLSRSMMQCNDEASANITPEVQKDARKMKKVEESVLSCISKTVDQHIIQLGPMKKRVASSLDQITK